VLEGERRFGVGADLFTREPLKNPCNIELTIRPLSHALAKRRKHYERSVGVIMAWHRVGH